MHSRSSARHGDADQVAWESYVRREQRAARCRDGLVLRHLEPGDSRVPYLVLDPAGLSWPEAQAWVEQRIAEQLGGRAVTSLTIDPDAETPVAVALLDHRAAGDEAGRRTYELSCWTSPAWRGHGLATGTARHAVAALRSRDVVFTLAATIDAANLPARRLATSLGLELGLALEVRGDAEAPDG